MPPRIFRRADWERGEGWNGGWNGHLGKTDVSFIFSEVTEAGLGPRLHTHDYDEVQIVRRGHATFRVGDETIEAEATEDATPEDEPIEVEASENATPEIGSSSP